ncbi:hypothetical protein ACIBSV_43010 [Embleya sp. NPDC050154]|uniref:hypothetical protein n=1 Tax=unclassified Embleya TaxID=2699296 RepID=UPI0037A4944C
MPQAADLGSTPDVALAALFDRQVVPGAAIGMVHGDADYVATQGVLTHGPRPG